MFSSSPSRKDNGTKGGLATPQCGAHLKAEQSLSPTESVGTGRVQKGQTQE